ncbi:MAG: hypothetical protein ACP5DC_05535 [Halothiobacillaceae bacterium]
MSPDLRDEHRYEPPLVTLLNRLYTVLRAQRGVLATGLFLVGALFLMQWQALAATSVQGYPALGIPFIALAIALMVAPLTLVATLLVWHVRLREEYLSFRDMHWLQSMVERHPSLALPFRPYLESRTPVHVNALRKIWPRLIRAEEHQ